MTRFLEKLSKNLENPVKINSTEEVKLSLEEEKTYENIQNFFSSKEGKKLIPKDIRDM